MNPEKDREISWMRVQLGYLWEFLIAEDMEERSYGLRCQTGGL